MILLNIFPGPETYQDSHKIVSHYSCETVLLPRSCTQGLVIEVWEGVPEELTGKQKRILTGGSSMCLGPGIAGLVHPRKADGLGGWCTETKLERWSGARSRQDLADHLGIWVFVLRAIGNHWSLFLFVFISIFVISYKIWCTFQKGHISSSGRTKLKGAY